MFVHFFQSAIYSFFHFRQNSQIAEPLFTILSCILKYSEEEYADSLQHINENIEEIKQHLLDDNMVVKKDTDRLTVKNYPN